RYLYAFNPIFRRVILDLYRVDTYHDLYDRAEDLFYSDEREGDDEDQARSFELAQLSPPPKTKPFALSYRHAAFLSQLSPDTDGGRHQGGDGHLDEERIVARRDESLLPGPLSGPPRIGEGASGRTVSRGPRKGLGGPTAHGGRAVRKLKIRPLR